jgi:hypothetical protein
LYYNVVILTLWWFFGQPGEKEVRYMKKRLSLAVALLLFASVAISFAYAQTWQEVYSYSDDYSEGGLNEINEQRIDLHRTYAVKSQFKRVIVGRVMISKFQDHLFQTEEAKNWASPRIAITSPNNDLRRYEIRFLPELNKVQANYVDRTGRTGVWTADEENTISEILASSDCEIITHKWYYPVITNHGNKWRVTIMSDNQPTCFLEWKDKRVFSARYVLGIQSAGKYLESKFDKIFGV